MSEALAAPWRAACMSDDEWATWSESNDRLVGKAHAALPCQDCLPAFAAEMRAEGRCNGTPRETEKEPMLDDRDELARRQIAAVRGGEARLAQVREAKPDAVELVPETPCGTCAHALVCAWKRDLEAIGDVPVRLPELADGLTMTLRAVVECSAYLRAPRAKADPRQARTEQAFSAVWTPERRARQSELTKRRNLERAAAKAAASA
jgi:hypothetical protein